MVPVKSYLVSSYGVLQMQYSFVSFLVSLEVVVIIFFFFDLAAVSSSYLRLYVDGDVVPVTWVAAAA